MYSSSPELMDVDSRTIALGDSFSELYENDGPPSAESLLNFARVAQGQLEADGAEITINPDNLTRLNQPEQHLSARAQARQHMENFRQMIQRVTQRSEMDGSDRDMRAALALMFHPNAEGELPALAEALAQGIPAEHLKAAEDLGCPIPELKIHFDEEGVSDGDFEVGAGEKERIDLVRNALGYGDRSFAFRGPPGSGKGEFASQIAAILRCPFVPINVGPSNDLEQNIGGDGLRAQTITTMEPVLDGSGKPIMKTATGPDGQPLLNPETKEPILEPMTVERQTVVTVSKTIYGPLTEAAKRPCIIEIQEPEGMEQEAIRLHSMLGEKVGEPDRRYLNINSSAAGTELTVPVHKDAIIIFTYNPGQEDVKLKQATHDRCVNLDFDYPTKEAECRRLAKIVNRVLRDESNTVPDELRIGLKPEELEPFVGIVDKMRNAAKEDAGFIEEPGSRTAARLCLQLMHQAFGDDHRGDRTVRLLLDYCRSYEEKATSVPDAKINQILADELPALSAFNDHYYHLGLQARGEPLPEDAAKTTKKKPTK